MYKVLVVEDESRIRRGLIYRLDWVAMGCTVPLEAANGEEGLACIQSEKPDIVITDVKMPLLDGIAMLEQAVRLHTFESIIISGYDDFAYAQTAMRLGVTDYLLKPVDMEELRAAIFALCEKAEKRQLYSRIEAIMDKDTQPDPVLDMVALNHSLTRTSKRVTAALRFIQANYRQRISLKDLGRDMEVSSTYLNQKFKEEMGYTFNDFLNRFRIQKAVELLQAGDYRIYEVAEQTGFSDYRYFALVFKKYVGCAPTEFVGAAEAPSPQ
ncbi:response regulator [Ruminococcaceae bacterium OttesenSCG-928-L11]|nr:response regulator [Ruminococcaceae bacterium OttesenSCG-928-L11]